MNTCTRCGKKRIISNSYSEIINGSKIIYTMTVCPDPECQKVVERSLQVEADKRKFLREEQEKRAREHVAVRGRPKREEAED